MTAAAAQTIVGGPQYTSRAKEANAGEKHRHWRSVCLCHVGAILAVSCCQQDACLSQLSKKSRRMLETKVSYDWEIGWAAGFFEVQDHWAVLL